MSGVVAIGETHELDGFALVGVAVRQASTPAAVTDAWERLEVDVGLVILSAVAARVLDTSRADRPDVLTVVMP